MKQSALADTTSFNAVISTLDQLKHAPIQLRDQARMATQFLDAQFSIARQISATSAPGTDPPAVRLRPQRQGEELPWSTLAASFSVPAGFEIEYPDELVRAWSDEAERALAAGDEPRLFPAPSADHVPRELRSTMQCAAYFAKVAKAPIPTCGPVSLVVYPALPTPPSPSAILFPPSSVYDHQRRLATSTEHDFLTLSSGERVSTVLDVFFADQQLEIERVARSEVAAARDWFRATAAQAGKNKMVATSTTKKAAAQPSLSASAGGKGRSGAGSHPSPATPSASAPHAPAKAPSAEADKEKNKRSGRPRGRGGANKGESRAAEVEKAGHPASKASNSSNKSRPTGGTLFVP